MGVMTVPRGMSISLLGITTSNTVKPANIDELEFLYQADRPSVAPRES